MRRTSYAAVGLADARETNGRYSCCWGAVLPGGRPPTLSRSQPFSQATTAARSHTRPALV
ncbi:hypothetical protein OG520_44955 (plasmid) [Streptomyces sp. NBC_00984]|uniref:hypothetical protein n=1 Tax=Streptomyces sp. NBC_00984 TaxID=2903700 RepID=UPI0038635FAC|nr:hypothetical protein OG520_44955 [Streptomyces sp. NBC_00984]